MTAAPPPPPDASAPPPAQTGWNQPPPPARPERPGLVTAAGITLIVMGVITGLVGILFLLGAAIFAGAAGGVDTSEVPGMGNVLGAFAGVFFVLVIIVIGWAALQLVSGIYVLGGREWARVLGLVVAIVGGLIALLGLDGGEDSNPVLSLVWLIAQAFVAYALFVGRPWFAARPA